MNTSHEKKSDGTDVWLTPRHILSPLGEFDLDPCSPINRPWDTAKNHFTVEDNGLKKEWFGRVWLNPPYGNQLEFWLHKMALHSNGIALTFGRTDTKAFHESIFPFAYSILFIQGRLRFCNPKGEEYKWNAGAPSVLIGYTEDDSDVLSESGISGKHLWLKDGVHFISLDRLEDKSWRVIVDKAMTRLNKHASLDEIYDSVSKLSPKRVNRNRNYKAKVRQILQYHFTRTGKATYSK